MPDTLNRIRNGDFSQGARTPRGWEWRARGGMAWTPAARAGNGDATGVHLQATSPTATGEWSQCFTTKKNQHYRIEAVVSCDCPASSGGLVLSLALLDAAGRTVGRLSGAPVRNAKRFTLRHFFKADEGVRRVELTVGLRGAGWAAVHDVRVLPVLEPDARAHPWAVPPPPFAYVAPVVAQKICVVTADAARPLIGVLRARYGASAVTVRSSASWHRDLDDADGVFLLDGPLPTRLKQLRGLKDFARQRVVIVSLPMMERISGANLAVRTVTQDDDPLHARVAYGDFVTSGFALRDIFPFAGSPDDSARQQQRQFRVNRIFRDYCARHEFHVLLDSETDRDATTEKPIALLHRTAGGAVVVLDCEPAEAVGSSLDEPALAARLLLNALGAAAPLVGQYVSPARHPGELLQQLRDTVERYPELAFADESNMLDPHAPQMITLGREMETLGLPLVRRPLVLIRSGLSGADTAGVYGVLLWLKHLLRPAPYACPYTNTLDRAFRVGWIPLAAPLTPWGGWQPAGETGKFPIEIEFEPGSIAACIDVAMAGRHAVRVVTSGRSERLARIHGALPALAEKLLAGRHLYNAVEAGADPADRRSAAWRSDDLTVEVCRDDKVFTEAWQRSARSAGADLIRIELPAIPSTDPAGQSIWLTDWAVTLLELITGLLVGTVLVNREARPLTLEVPAALRTLVSRATIRPINQPDQDRPSAALRGNRLTLPPASALVAVQP